LKLIGILFQVSWTFYADFIKVFPICTYFGLTLAEMLPVLHRLLRLMPFPVLVSLILCQLQLHG